MKEETSTTIFGGNFGQVAWVVPDIEATAKYFQEMLGVRRFLKMENLKSKELEGTYNGQPAEFEFHLYLAISGNTMLELIQPISGNSIYTDFLANKNTGGVQHIAFTVQHTAFEEAVAQLTGKGAKIIQSLVLPVAKVAYFDTYAEIGVATEIIGVTEAGIQFMEQLNSGDY